jgi:Major Facilitator Superfamily
LILDESYPPVLLVYKARRLRFETGNWALHAAHEEWDLSVSELMNKFMVRPFQMLFTPICFFVALYASFVYATFYLCLAAFPVVFQEGRGWSPVVSSLPFLAIALGAVIGGGFNVWNQTIYNKKFEANNNKPVPEARLYPMMLGSVLYSIGLFIFAWTAPPQYPWIACIIGIVLFGWGFFMIFQAALNYLIDTFHRYSASAIAANTFLRSLLAASFPLFTKQSKCLKASRTYFYADIDVRQ